MSALRNILLCIDGNEVTERAEDFALGIAKSVSAEICALYIVNPRLKKFAHEIYAVGREEYRRYIDEALREEGTAALERSR